MYKCRPGTQHRGALLYLLDKGHRKDIIPMKVFEKYIRDNVDNWFRWSKKVMLPVEHMEDLILVTGCTLVTSWAAAVFDGHVPVDSDAATISLEARKSDGGRAQFFWRNIRGNVEYHNSDFDPVCSPGYFFLAVNLCFFYRTRMFNLKNLYLRTNVSLSGVFVPSALSSGLYQSGLQPNPFLTTLTTVGRMRYK